MMYSPFFSAISPRSAALTMATALGRLSMMSRAVLPLRGRREIPRQPVDKHAGPHRLLNRKPQAEHGPDGARQHIARSRRRHPRVAAHVDPDAAVGQADECVGPLEDDDGIETGCRFPEDADGIFLDFFAAFPGDPGHL